jgi:hypothetical protein
MTPDEMSLWLRPPRDYAFELAIGVGELTLLIVIKEDISRGSDAIVSWLCCSDNSCDSASRRGAEQNHRASTQTIHHIPDVVCHVTQGVLSAQQSTAKFRKEPIEGRECTSSAPTIDYLKRGSLRQMSRRGARAGQLQKRAKSIVPFQANVVFAFALKEIWSDTGRLG